MTSSLSKSEKLERLEALKLASKLIDERNLRKSKRECEASLAEFARQAWNLLEPGTPLLWNWHLDVICAYLEAYYERRITRLIINVPPGSMKSLLVSVLGPAWVWTTRPERRLLSLASQMRLATRDTRNMRIVIGSDWYQKRWGSVYSIADDQDEKTHFVNSARGFRQGIGITGSIIGMRGTDLIIDDPIDAKEAFSDIAIQAINDTYDQAVASRLNDPQHDGVCLIMQRLRTNDLTGHLLAKKREKWVLVRIPMEYEGEPGFNPVKDLGVEYAHLADPRKVVGELMFPARIPRAEVEISKENLGSYGSAGQLQQRPSPLGGGMIKSSWWRQWPTGKPLPAPIHIFSSYDTAFSEKDHKLSAYSARTTWGIFEDEESGRHAMMLISAWWGRVGYPDLRKLAKAHQLEAKLDCSLVEKKASGQSLIQDLRRLRLPVRGFDPGKLDKTERAALATPLFESGLVWHPDRAWAREVVSFVGAFPNGAPPSADITDTVTQACLYVKRRMWANPPEEDYVKATDEERSEEWHEDQPKKRGSAYG